MNLQGTIDTENKNLTYEINEKQISDLHDTNIDFDINSDNFFSDFHEEYETFDEDNLLAQEIDYFENYTIKTLQYIASYYKIPKLRIKKHLLIQSIIEFENNVENSAIVYNRKRLWHYLSELKNDDFFSKYILFPS